MCYPCSTTRPPGSAPQRIPAAFRALPSSSGRCAPRTRMNRALAFYAFVMEIAICAPNGVTPDWRSAWSPNRPQPAHGRRQSWRFRFSSGTDVSPATRLRCNTSSQLRPPSASARRTPANDTCGTVRPRRKALTPDEPTAAWRERERETTTRTSSSARRWLCPAARPQAGTVSALRCGPVTV